MADIVIRVLWMKILNFHSVPKMKPNEDTDAYVLRGFRPHFVIIASMPAVFINV